MTDKQKWDMFKESYYRNLKRRIFCSNCLRVICYMLAGGMVFSLKWYLGKPIGTILIFIGLTIEEVIEKLKKEYNNLKKRKENKTKWKSKD